MRSAMSLRWREEAVCLCAMDRGSGPAAALANVADGRRGRWRWEKGSRRAAC